MRGAHRPRSADFGSQWAAADDAHPSLPTSAREPVPSRGPPAHGERSRPADRALRRSRLRTRRSLAAPRPAGGGPRREHRPAGRAPRRAVAMVVRPPGPGAADPHRGGLPLGGPRGGRGASEESRPSTAADLLHRRPHLHRARAPVADRALRHDAVQRPHGPARRPDDGCRAAPGARCADHAAAALRDGRTSASDSSCRSSTAGCCASSASPWSRGSSSPP